MIVFFDQLPPSANNLYSSVDGRRVRSRAYRRWDREVSIELPQEFIRYTELCAVQIEMVKPSFRRMDLANREKALIDRVVYMGLLDDDALIHDLRIRWVGQIDGAKYFEPAASVAIRKNLSYLRE